MLMSDDILHVEYTGVNSVSTAFQDAVKAMQQMLDQLDQDVTSSGMNTYWSGAAQTEYSEVKANWNQILANTASDLNVMSGIMDEISHLYNTTDDNIALNWQQIR
jgi:WXG100 family type VII secretion target